MPGPRRTAPTWFRWGVLALLTAVVAAGRAGGWFPPVGATAAQRVPIAPQVRQWPAPVRPGAPVPQPAPPVRAAAALVMDGLTGTVLYDFNAQTRRPPASTTKVLTALLALELGNLDAVVEVSPRAAGTEGSSMHLRAGDRYQLRELLNGLLLNSGNDAAVAIAEHLSGSVEAFAERMNQRTRELGATQSNFVNPHGLHHPAHFSSAYDLAIITRTAFSHPEFAEIVRQRALEWQHSQSDRTVRLHNTNRLLGLFAGADGVKTGTTSAAGACLISSATRTDAETGTPQQIIAVVLDDASRWQDSVRLLEWAYQTFQLQRWLDPGEVVARVRIAGGQEPAVGVAVAGPVAAVIGRNTFPELQLKWQVPTTLQAPIAAGTQVGHASLQVHGRVMAEVPLVAAETVPVATWATRLVSPWLEWLEWLSRQGVLE